MTRRSFTSTAAAACVLALGACDRLLLLDGGRAVLEGAPEVVGADARLDAAFGVRFERSTQRGRMQLMAR